MTSYGKCKNIKRIEYPFNLVNVILDEHAITTDEDLKKFPEDLSISVECMVYKLLTDSQRKIILYRYKDKLSVKDIAVAMGYTSEATIRLHENRALNVLRSNISTYINTGITMFMELQQMKIDQLIERISSYEKLLNEHGISVQLEDKLISLTDHIDRLNLRARTQFRIIMHFNYVGVNPTVENLVKCVNPNGSITCIRHLRKEDAKEILRKLYYLGFIDKSPLID